MVRKSVDSAGLYCRTPLPPSSRMYELLLAFLFMTSIALAIIGLNEGNHNIFWLSVFGFVIFLLAVIRGIARFQALPQSIRDEYTRGKLFEPRAKTKNAQANPFGLGASKRLFILDETGVRFSSDSLVKSYLHFSNDYKTTQIHTTSSNGDILPAHVIPWTDIDEWEVHTDSDGPDYYHLRLIGKPSIALYRVPDPESEYRALDLIRDLGQRSVRIFCDIPLPHRQH